MDRDLGSISFIQIGSNDANFGDPLRPFILKGRWRGVMVEPIPYVFLRLKNNYKDVPGLQFEQVAIADERKTLPFFHVVESTEEERNNLPEWYDQIGSFDRNHVLAHGNPKLVANYIPQIEQRIRTTELPCITFDDLCDKTGVHSPDILHMDTEGYDLTLMRSIDLDRHRPRLIVFERKHVSSAELSDYRKILRIHGYRSLLLPDDIVCLRIGPWLLGAWRTAVAWIMLGRALRDLQRRKGRTIRPNV